jgi:hypothetical protein
MELFIYKDSSVTSVVSFLVLFFHKTFDIIALLMPDLETGETLNSIFPRHVYIGDP